jgi:hypothetical protein
VRGDITFLTYLLEVFKNLIEAKLLRDTRNSGNTFPAVSLLTSDVYELNQRDESANIPIKETAPLLVPT